jgi:hypothetical protein
MSSSVLAKSSGVNVRLDLGLLCGTRGVLELVLEEGQAL